MDKEIAILTNQQMLLLRTIGEQANQIGECDISRIKSDALEELEREAYITIDAAQKTARITALGKMALENHVIAGSPEFFRLQLGKAGPADENGLSIEFPPPETKSKPYAGVMGKPKHADKSLIQIVREAAAPLIGNPEPPAEEVAPESTPEEAAWEKATCAKTGCFEPRTVSKSGRRLQLCDTHQREHMTEQAAKARAGKAKKAQSQAVSIEAPRPNGRPREQVAVNVPDASPETVFVEAVIEQPVVTQACEPGCAGCIHREVLDMLRAKYPKVDDLVQAMERVRELQNSLGLEG